MEWYGLHFASSPTPLGHPQHTMSIVNLSISDHTTASIPRPHILYVIQVVRSDGSSVKVAKRYSEVSEPILRETLRLLTTSRIISFWIFTIRSMTWRCFLRRGFSSRRSPRPRGSTTDSSRSARPDWVLTSPHSSGTHSIATTQPCSHLHPRTGLRARRYTWKTSCPPR